MSIKVSVIVPVYKTAPYVRQCLDSLLGQRLRDIEIICVDDGSPDNAGEILDEYAKKDSRVHVIHQENRGLGCAYNAGRRIARGEYIGFLDSDDWVETSAFYDLYRAARETKADVVKAGGMFWEKEHSTELTFKIPVQKCNRLIRDLMEVPEFVNGHVTQWTAIYKRSFLDENDIWSPEEGKNLTPDIAFVYKVWVLAKSLYILPAAYVHYRQRSDAATKQGSTMSFRLIAAHEEATREMEKLSNVTADHWAVKSRVEYEHFLFDWNFRCNTKRLKYIRHVAQLFRQAIRFQRVKKEMLGESGWTLYQFIAYMPFLFWLNNVFLFWTKKFRKEVTTSYRLFGVIKIMETPSRKVYYFLGIPYWSERLYFSEFKKLADMNFALRNELNQLRNQLERRKK